jgi:hypothetical protein
MPTLADLRACVAQYNKDIAVGYWGPEKLYSPDGKPSPIADRLMESVFKSFSTPGLSGIGPENFIELMHYFSILDLDFEDAQLSAFDRDVIATKYYIAMDTNHEYIVLDNRTIPVASAKGITMWINVHLLTEPEKTAIALQKLLENSDRPLLDSEKGIRFLYTSIPLQVLPEANASVGIVLKEAQEKWAVCRKEIIDELKQNNLSEMNGLGRLSPTLQQVTAMREYSQRLQEQRSLNTAANLQKMTQSSLEASLASQNYWNSRNNAAKMSWGNF